MAMALGGGSGGRGRIARTTLAEINVTPLVDVMLVLLVIFMTASSIETARLSREAETLRQVVGEEIAAVDAPPEDQQQVPVDLPKAQADKLTGAGGKNAKPMLSIDGKRRIFLDKQQLVDCGAHKDFDACLDAFEAALSGSGRGPLRDVHLRADRKLSYDDVLRLMARMRRAGIQHFGLVTEAPAAAATPAATGGGAARPRP